jgi:hypothetical protein
VPEGAETRVDCPPLHPYPANRCRTNGPTCSTAALNNASSRSQCTLLQPIDIEPALRKQPRTVCFHKRVWDVPAGVKYRGDEVARAADIYSTAFPDMHRELSDLYFDGDVVVVQLSLNGTHQGDLPMGLGTLPCYR